MEQNPETPNDTAVTVTERLTYGSLNAMNSLRFRLDTLWCQAQEGCLEALVQLRLIRREVDQMFNEVEDTLWGEVMA